MSSLIKFLKLNFDRSFSGNGWRQLAWLTGAILSVFLIIYAVSFYFSFPEPSAISFTQGDKDAPLGRILQLIGLFIDPGNLNNVPPHLRWFALGVIVIGLILFCGILISVFSNMLERRVERFREGDIYYSLSNHVVIIGFNNMVPSLVLQICNDNKFKGCDILIQSSESAQEIRNKIHTELNSKEEKRIIILHARRDSTEEIAKLHTTKAREVFLIGEKEEHDHDSLSLDCLKKIVELHAQSNCNRLIPFTVLFEYQTSFAAFQIIDLAEKWRKHIEFKPFNFYEGWAKKVLVNQQYDNHTPEGITYPPLDREPITYESPKHIHLVIVGMSRMGVALGIEAAHISHFPNFCRDNKNKTVITFIDDNADREMNFFRGRYRHFFDIAPTCFTEIKDGTITHSELPPNAKTYSNTNFLDVRFEFIKGRAEDPIVQDMFQQWAESPHETLTIAVCLCYPPESMAMGLYLPDSIYEKNIPVFIRQETSSTLLEMLSENKKTENIHRFSHVYPFGMLDNCYDLDNESIKIAQAVSYVYQFYNTYNTIPQTLPDEQELKTNWNKLSVSHQWSNLYNAYSVKIKLRSLGINNYHCFNLTEKQIAILAETEHNRWNIEKLLLGYRKPTACQLAEIKSSKDKKKEYKEKLFVHPDICPYDELSESSKQYDISITACLPLVMKEYKQV